MAEEKLPLSDFYKVLSHKTVYKSEKWWEAVVLTEAFGRRTISLYLWIKRDGQWKRKHKFVVRSLDEWHRVKDIVESMVPEFVAKR